MSWKLRSSEPLVSNRWLKFLRNSYELPGGQVVDDYYVLERRDFVMAVAERDGRVVLARQYRPATGKHYWSLPAGYIDPGESPEQAAVREVREETGLAASDAESVGAFDPLPGYIRSRAHVVACRIDGGAPAGAADGEVDEVAWRTWPEVLAMVRSGEIDEMQAASALLLVHLRRNPL